MCRQYLVVLSIWREVGWGVLFPAEVPPWPLAQLVGLYSVLVSTRHPSNGVCSEVLHYPNLPNICLNSGPNHSDKSLNAITGEGWSGWMSVCMAAIL